MCHHARTYNCYVCLYRELGTGVLARKWADCMRVCGAVLVKQGHGICVCVAIVHVNGTCMVGIAWCMYREPSVMLTRIAELVQEVAAAPGPECTVLRLRGTCGLAARWAAGCSRAR